MSPEIIRFTWDPPPIQFQNGLIRSYMIKVMENETGVVTQHSTTMTQINLNSLHAYYVYELVVAAVTVASGPFSQPVTVQTHPDGKQLRRFNAFMGCFSVSIPWSLDL